MDTTQITAIVNAHAQAIVDPLDLAHVQADLIPELHPAIPEIAALLPQPVTSASVDSLDVGPDHAIAVITYTGEEASVSLRSRWEQRAASQPQVVHAAPA